MVYYLHPEISLVPSIFIILFSLTCFSFFIDSKSYAESDIIYIENSPAFFYSISTDSPDDTLESKIKDRLSSSSDSFDENGIIGQLPLPNEDKSNSDSSKIIVTTQVINDGGGKKKASDFATVVSGNNPDPSTFPGNSKGTTVT
ncbi:MAG: hypothetical protein ACPKPY_08945, partial [Nitrososphaeraceae archaeon]